MTEIHANARALSPLWKGSSHLQRRFKDVHWTTKGMKILKVWFDCCCGKLGEWVPCIVLTWQAVTQVDCIFQCLRPEVCCNCFRPSMASVKERGACAFCDVADTSLRDPILVVRADTAERNGLLGQLDSPDECSVCKSGHCRNDNA